MDSKIQTKLRKNIALRFIFTFKITSTPSLSPNSSAPYSQSLNTYSQTLTTYIASLIAYSHSLAAYNASLTGYTVPMAT
jgi:hypothetical protein